MNQHAPTGKSALSGWSSRILPPAMLYFLCEPLFRRMGRRTLRTRAKLDCLRRILIVRLDDIGDFVMTTPLLRELRRNCPWADISLVVKPSVLNLAETCPYVDRVLPYNPESGRWIHLRRLWKAWRFARQKLWSMPLDAVLLPRWDADLSGAIFVAYFSGAAIRMGHSEKMTERHRRENRGYNTLLTSILSDRAVKHEVLRNLQMLRAMDGQVYDDKLELWLMERDEAFADAFLARHAGNRTSAWVALRPGSSLRRKSWPLSRFLAVAKQLRRSHGVLPLILLGPDDEDLAAELESEGHGLLAVAMGTTLREEAALLKRCKLFIGGDSGPKHMAAALGVPVLEINATPINGDVTHPNTTSPKRFGPWGVRHRILAPTDHRPPCVGACTAEEAHCILGVSVSQVCEAAEALGLEREKVAP